MARGVEAADLCREYTQSDVFVSGEARAEGEDEVTWQLEGEVGSGRDRVGEYGGSG